MSLHLTVKLVYRALMEVAIGFFDPDYLTLTERSRLMMGFKALQHKCLITDVVHSADKSVDEYRFIANLLTELEICLPPQLGAHLLRNACCTSELTLPAFLFDRVPLQTVLGTLTLTHDRQDDCLYVFQTHPWGSAPQGLCLRVRSYDHCHKGEYAIGHEHAVLPISQLQVGPHPHMVPIPVSHTVLVTCSQAYGILTW